MSPRPFEPMFMKLSVLTAALPELAPRPVRDRVRDAIARSAQSGRWRKVRAS